MSSAGGDQDLAPYPSLARANAHSRAAVEALREGIAKLNLPAREAIAVSAVGSYGRGEATDVSDFEWITVYDDSAVAAEEAIVFQAAATSYFASVFGRRKLSINKTFGEVVGLSRLVTNVGGEADTNKTLTYRMLALAEGVSLTPDANEMVIAALARTYGGSHTAGHRLLSLATDIARYWRTLRIDYKFKVDEARKSWALRSVKLRSYRRIWYFASAVHFVAFGPRIEYSLQAQFDIEQIKSFMRTMGGNPVLRLISSLRELGVDSPLTHSLLEQYDAIHAACNDPEMRAHLDSLPAELKTTDPPFDRLREACRSIHHLAADLVVELPTDSRRELIEMFLL